MKRRQRAAGAVSHGAGVPRGRRTLPEWAVAGLLLPMVGGASLGGSGGGDPTATGAASAPSTAASVTAVPAGRLADARPPAAPDRPVADARTASDTVPALLWQAYDAAAKGTTSGCHLPVTLLAAIGQVESASLAGRALDPGHRVVPAVLGPVLDGGRFAAIRDTDGGELDGDRQWDRAVGPMQFIPGTWARWRQDGDHDGAADPQDIEDASATAAAYLCAGGRDLATDEDLRAAILSYNHSAAYLALVLRWKHAFEVIPPDTGPIDTVLTATQPHTAHAVTAATAAVVHTPVEPAPPPAPPPSPQPAPQLAPPPAQPEPRPPDVAGPGEQPSDPAPAVEPTADPEPTWTTPVPAPPPDDPTDDPTDDPAEDPTEGATGEQAQDPGTPVPLPEASEPTPEPVATDPCETPDATPPAPAP